MSTATQPRPYAVIPFAKVRLTTTDSGLPEPPEIDGKPVVAKAIAVFQSADSPVAKVVLEQFADQVDFEGFAEVVFFEPENPSPGTVVFSEEAARDLVERAGLQIEFDGKGGAVISAKDDA